ncbi:MAG: hypothetical protein A3J54_01770 [Candidatus Ryanbacteria bacterium RIFCSPHIGHO2_02_FULL_45_13b]|uniref:RNA polymerase alpha subunit C-terminal domain-containing protein n=1 Tax=Candidatus Ryanbacteria bacterium RIFCSPHIGHO2_02_FULL_45_13b TaxID=1802117 RepID=A0A1G2GAJ4_9BACT|nr:MAG: hypothetical protein A3J54_01770 [Candidatus Ryanbacteria bacterium RIFCSPHIGHO2_02_FULL_45_13b]
MSYNDYVLQAILEIPLSEFDGDMRIPTRLETSMRGAGVYTLQETFTQYPNEKSLLSAVQVGKKTVRDFVAILEELEKRHGVQFEWLENPKT